MRVLHANCEPILMKLYFVTPVGKIYSFPQVTSVMMVDMTETPIYIGAQIFRCFFTQFWYRYCWEVWAI